MIDYDDDWQEVYHSYHNDHLEEECDTIIKSLGPDGANFLHLRVTPKGCRIIELIDHYKGVTLTKDQLDRFIEELKLISDELGKQEPWQEGS
ncbi:hypothetical protein [uncultured Tateyamaria sp.]|uniref:hypothetical protein n=1 Tax=uncultured Tateyamaria sp. TaxID=455651 RepID=UPI00261A3473|nr:hypothetical protein [uncultured Tateyamaria sp.]